MEGFVPRLWGLEECSSPILSLERQRGMGECAREVDCRDPDYEWLMIDATHIKIHPHAAALQMVIMT